MSYSNQANRLMGLVKNLENKYNKNEILYNDAVNLIKKYHSDIDQLASNAKVKHANKKLAKLNLAVVKQDGIVDFPVRIWNKYLNAAEQAVQNAINKPTPQNITVAQNKINDVTNNQNKIENIVNKVPNAPKPPNTPVNNKPPNAPKNMHPNPLYQFPMHPNPLIPRSIISPQMHLRTLYQFPMHPNPLIPRSIISPLMHLRTLYQFPMHPSALTPRPITSLLIPHLTMVRRGVISMGFLRFSTVRRL